MQSWFSSPWLAVGWGVLYLRVPDCILQFRVALGVGFISTVGCACERNEA